MGEGFGVRCLSPPGASLLGGCGGAGVWVGGVCPPLCLSFRSKKKHKEKKRKREEDAEEQLDIVGERPCRSCVAVGKLQGIAQVYEVLVGRLRQVSSYLSQHTVYKSHFLRYQREFLTPVGSILQVFIFLMHLFVYITSSSLCACNSCLFFFSPRAFVSGRETYI